MHTQLAVLGGGPGGYAAAFMAADLGAEVTLVEAEAAWVARACCAAAFPRKPLLHVARVIGEVDELRENWGVEYGPPKIDLDKVRARKDQVIDTLTGGLGPVGQAAERAGDSCPRVVRKFHNPPPVRRRCQRCPEDRRADVRPSGSGHGVGSGLPHGPAVDSPRVMDSTGALNWWTCRESLLVVGGGYIGLEMGTVYAKLGSRVSVVELTDGLLPGADRNLVKPLHKRLDKLFRGADLPEHASWVRWAIAATRSRRRSKARRSTAPSITTECWSPWAGGPDAGDRPGEHPGRIEPSRIRGRGPAAADGRSPRSWPSATWSASRCWPTRPPTKARSPSRPCSGHPAGVRTGGDSRRHLHRPGDRLGRADGRPGQARGPQGGGGRVPVGGQRPGPGARPHRRIDQMDHRSDKRTAARLRHRRTGCRRVDRRGGAGDRNAVRSADVVESIHTSANAASARFLARNEFKPRVQWPPAIDLRDCVRTC